MSVGQAVVAVSSVLFCDVCPGENLPATALYRWAWGEEGACSQKGQFLLEQRSENIGQKVTISPLAPVAAPVTRDERAMLMGKSLALEAELVEVKAQMVSLYAETEKLRSDNRLQFAQLQGGRIAIQQAELREQTVRAAHDELSVRLGEVTSERDRLQAMMPSIDDLQSMDELRTSNGVLQSRIDELEELAAAKQLRIDSLEAERHVIE